MGSLFTQNRSLAGPNFLGRWLIVWLGRARKFQCNVTFLTLHLLQSQLTDYSSNTIFYQSFTDTLSDASKVGGHQQVEGISHYTWSFRCFAAIFVEILLKTWSQVTRGRDTQSALFVQYKQKGCHTICSFKRPPNFRILERKARVLLSCFQEEIWVNFIQLEQAQNL